MPVKSENEYGFAMACLGLGLKLSCIITGKLLKSSDNVFDQFIGVHITSIFQQYFKVTITNQFEPNILNLIQFVSKVLVIVGGNHIIKVGMGDVSKIPTISLKTRDISILYRNFFPSLQILGIYMHNILCHVM